MKTLAWSVLFGVVTLFGVSPDSLVAQIGGGGTCWLCTEYNSGGEKWHFWPDWGGGVCDEPEEQSGNEDCDLKPEDEETEMPGYPGPCPNDEECGGANEEEEELLLSAIDRYDLGGVVSMLRGSDHIALNKDRAAIQLLSCAGLVVAHIPLQPSAVAELSKALVLDP